MKAVARFLALVVVALALAFGRPAVAAPQATLGPAPSSEESPSIAPPSDAPIVVHGARVTIPDVPASWVDDDRRWLRARYPDAFKARAQPALEAAERFKPELASRLGKDVLSKVEVRIVRDADEMARLAPPERPPPKYAAGVAYPALKLVLVSLVDPKSFEGTDLVEVLKHELAHVALEDAVGGHHVPRWFNEGLAIHLSGELAVARLQTLSQASLSGTLLPLADIDRRFPDSPHEVNIAYAESADFVRFLLRDQDSERFRGLVDRVSRGDSFDRALTDSYGAPLRNLEFQWRDDLSHRFSVWPALVGGTAVWMISVGALVIAYVKRRKKAKATLARWAIEEAEEDRIALEARAAEEALLRSIPPPAQLPSIEYQGRYYTIH